MASHSEIIRQRGEFETTAIGLYERYAKEYQTIVPRYKILLEKKKELGILPLHTLSKSYMREFPDIPLLKAANAQDALNLITEMNTSELAFAINNIYRYSESAILASLRSVIADYQYEINQYGKPKAFVGVGEKYIQIGRHMHHHISAKDN